MKALAYLRINYKSDFILTLNSDAGWMTPFCIKFWTGAPSQAYFAGWDGDTYTHCTYDPSEPTKLVVQFDDHHLPIGDLKFQIAYHFTVADFPNDTEDEVINPANITTEIDGQEYQVMLDFTGETAPEIEFSLPAYANEAQRIANEQQRIANEQQRIANEQQRIADEQTRIANEETRQRNESTRIAQEEARVSEFARLKRESQQATTDANDAATLANQKAQLAQDKAALAQEAATLANQKAQLAADKAALANDAAQLANEKAALANQKAEYAQTQGGYAKDQGDYAKDQGDHAKAQGTIAEEDHQRAEADHGIAVDDHTQAGNDHTRAESDHGIAADDHTQAGNDHTRAESDHGIAADDHTQAGNDHTRAESDHGIAADDHTQAGNDHTRAESDHTRAESDHAAVEVYVDSLGAFDISAYNATGGVLAKYADLTAALGTNGANIPDALRKGGMSVKFVLSSDNNYIQARLMANTFTTDVSQWQVVDNEPTARSNNLVKSSGVESVVFKKFFHVDKKSTQHTIFGKFKAGDILILRVENAVITGYTSAFVAVQDIYGNIIGIIQQYDFPSRSIQMILTQDYDRLNINSRTSPDVEGSISADVYFEVYDQTTIPVTKGNCFFATYPIFLRNLITEFYIENIDSYTNYDIEFYFGSSAVYLNLVGDNSLVGQGVISTGIINIEERNNSGVYGYAVINAADITRISGRYRVNKDTVRNLNFSPSIKNYINSFSEEHKNLRYFANKQAVDAISNSLRELYLTGITNTKTYSYRYLISSNNLGIAQVFDGTSWVAQGVVDNNGFAIISPLNSSGVSGYFVEGTRPAATTGERVLDYSYISNLEASEEIYNYLYPKSEGKIYTVKKSGGSDFTSLLEAILAATKYMDSVVYVDEGVYNLVDEFTDYYGADFFTSYASNNPVKGIHLKNRVKVIFASLSTVEFNYTGNNENVMIEFSPFNAGQHGFTLENLNVVCSNCRYCVHDERASDTDAYHNTYKNCSMYLDNSNNTGWASKQCIGGGLGKDGEITISECTFESIGINSTRPDLVSWHNSAAAGAKSFISLTNCYFKGIGGFRLSWYGTSTLITEALVSGNSFGSDIVVRAETGSSTVENVSVTDWNNIVRQ